MHTTYKGNDMLPLVQRIINEEDSVKIAVRLKDGKQIGSLTPVTKSALKDDAMVGRLTDWRNSMRTCFLTQAAVSPETTRAFLANSLFKDATRMLFIVHSLNQPIGTLGIKLAPPWVHGAGPSAAEASGHRLAELANLLLGVRDGHPMLMYHGELALIDWVFRTLNIALVWTAVPSDNRLALTLHKSAGFKQTERIPLIRQMKNGEPQLVPGEPGAESPDHLYAQRIELNRADFFARQQTTAHRPADGESVAPLAVSADSGAQAVA
jgi:hypothetical protein